MARQQQYTLGRVFVGGRPLEDLTAEERAEFQRRTVQRMGEVLTSYFSRHPDVYVRVCEKYATEDTSPVSVNVAAVQKASGQIAVLIEAGMTYQDIKDMLARKTISM